MTLQRARCRTSLEILRESGSVSGRGNTPGRSLPQPCFVVCIRIVSCSLPKRIFLPPNSNSQRSQRLLDTECSKVIRDILSEEVMRQVFPSNHSPMQPSRTFNTTRRDCWQAPNNPGAFVSVPNLISRPGVVASARCSILKA